MCILSEAKRQNKEITQSIVYLQMHNLRDIKKTAYTCIFTFGRGFKKISYPFLSHLSVYRTNKFICAIILCFFCSSANFDAHHTYKDNTRESFTMK